LLYGTRKTCTQKPPTVICTHTLTQEADEFLQRLSREATDALGWTVGKSAIVRALLQYAAPQPSSWVSTILLPLAEQEIDTGIVWGRQKK
jgi:hypothetical protein